MQGNHKTISELAEPEIEFYAALGLLGTRFSELEAHLTSILSLLIAPDNEFLTTMLTEQQTLNQKLEQIKKLIRYRSSYEPELRILLSEVNSFRRIRNLFVHGVWTLWMEDGRVKEAVCTEHKVKFEEVVHPGGGKAKQWTSPQRHAFTLGDLKAHAGKASRLCTIAESMVSQLEEDEDLKY